MTASTDLVLLRDLWDRPFLADPSDEEACAVRSELTRALARLLLAAPLGTQVGGMTVYTAGWSLERSQAASAAGEAGSPEWYAALGDPEHATLTADGRAADRTAWCNCRYGQDAGTWVRYEHWTERGMDRHGYVCQRCRRLTQTG